MSSRVFLAPVRHKASDFSYQNVLKPNLTLYSTFSIRHSIHCLEPSSPHFLSSNWHVVFSINPGSNRKEEKGARISGETEVAISPLKHENLNLIALIFTLLKPDSRMKALVQWAKLKSSPSSISPLCGILFLWWSYNFSLNPTDRKLSLRDTTDIRY
jgi:hypothetical protein